MISCLKSPRQCYQMIGAYRMYIDGYIAKVKRRELIFLNPCQNSIIYQQIAYKYKLEDLKKQNPKQLDSNEEDMKSEMTSRRWAMQEDPTSKEKVEESAMDEEH